MQAVKRGGGGSRKARRSGVISSVMDDIYSTRLNIYETPPVNEISMEDFETLAIERVKLLKAVEEAGVSHSNKHSPDYKRAMYDCTRKHMPLSNKGDDDSITERKNDHLSHFILRLAYCRNSELRNWFLTQECALFRFRFEDSSKEESNMLLSKHTSYNPITDEDKLQIAPQLMASGYRMTMQDVHATDYFKVPFEEAVDPLKKRQVYVSAGYSYIPRDSVIEIVKGHFRSKLSRALLEASKALPNLNEDERILPMLTSLGSAYLGKNDFSSSKFAGTVTPAQLDDLSKISMPLCMRVTYEHIKKEHHIKHGGRMQYGLFLKGIGLSLEDALIYWRSEFTKKISSDKFEKSYAYNIRHNYGKEGKRTDYTPYNCMKIIMGNAPSAGDCHGCPFRHWDKGPLKTTIQKYGVSHSGANEIIALVEGHHYQLACQKYFAHTHMVAKGVDKDAAMMSGLQHPVQYFEESQKIIRPDFRAGENKYLKSMEGDDVASVAADTPMVSAE